MKNKFSALLGLFIFCFVFILISFFVQSNISFIEKNLEFGSLGIIIYMIFTIFATVVAPISAIPLLPLAVALWGPILAAIYSIIAWTIGAIIAFLISRKYGVKLVKKIVSIEDFSKYQSFIPKKNEFINIILIRIFLPVDLFSYLLGLFSKVNLKTYTLATFIGVIPFAFILSFIGSLSTSYQLLSFSIGGILFGILYYNFLKRN